MIEILIGVVEFPFFAIFLRLLARFESKFSDKIMISPPAQKFHSVCFSVRSLRLKFRIQAIINIRESPDLMIKVTVGSQQLFFFVIIRTRIVG